MIAQFTAEFGINSTCNALNSIWLHLMLFRTLLVLLISNSTVNCVVTYTNSNMSNNNLVLVYGIKCTVVSQQSTLHDHQRGGGHSSSQVFILSFVQVFIHSLILLHTYPHTHTLTHTHTHTYPHTHTPLHIPTHK